MVGLITPEELIPQPHELVSRNGPPGTIEGWQALADGLLTDQSCVFHRNLEISSRYAWIYKHLPACFKWAGMAAFASHHVRLALFPFRLDTDRTGYVDIPRSLGRQKALLLEDVDTIRATNNAIFDDIFWVHLAYGTAEDGIERLRALLGAEPHYAPVLAGFEAIDQGRRVLEDATASAEAREAADDLIWEGNVQLLEHEQRALVQPNFDRLSCAFARLFSIGSALSFEVRGVRQEALVLHVVLPLLAHPRDPAALRCACVAADHPLRRPLALDRDEHRPPLPAIRCRRAPGRRQPAPHLRRGARLRVEPLRPTADRRSATMSFTNIATAGAGTMGSQVAWQMAFHGKHVTVYDAIPAGLEKGRELHRTYAEHFVGERGATQEQIDGTFARLTYTTDLAAAVGDADLISESVPESMAIKESFWREASRHAPLRTVFTTNTSTLSPSALAGFVDRPEKFLALHFAIGVWDANIGEVMGHPGTDAAVFEGVLAFAGEIGLVPIPLRKEHGGYIINSLLVPWCTAALDLLVRGVSDVHSIDRTWMITLQTGIGPCGMMDRMGLGVVYHVAKLIGETTPNAQALEAARFLDERFIQQGLLGVATGEGFYRYPRPAFEQPGFI